MGELLEVHKEKIIEGLDAIEVDDIFRLRDLFEPEYWEGNIENKHGLGTEFRQAVDRNEFLGISYKDRNAQNHSEYQKNE